MYKDIKNDNNEIRKNSIEKFMSFATQIYYGRRNGINDKKLEEIHSSLMHLLDVQKKNFTIEEYTKIKQVIDNFDDLMHDQEVIKSIQSREITREQFIERYRKLLLGNERTKFDLSSLYNSGLISTNKNNGISKKVLLKFNEKNQTYTFQDEEGRKINITLYGRLMYEEWNSISSYINLYRIQQETKAGEGKMFDDMVYTNIVIPNMSDMHYRNLVINELLNVDNIKNAHCGGYIGEIIRQRAKTQDDKPHTETQSKSGYAYRIDQDYILQYDATTVTAAMNMPVPEIDSNNIEKQGSDLESSNKDRFEDYEK